jgi:hypothetical protein
MKSALLALNIIAGFMVAAMAIFIYLFPAYIAIRRKHKLTTLIYIINLFLGWTLLGWIISLILACLKASETKNPFQPLFLSRSKSLK